MEPQKILKSHNNLKNKVEGVILPDIKLYNKSIAIITSRYWHKNRHRSMEQNREPRNKPTPCLLYTSDAADEPCGV